MKRVLIVDDDVCIRDFLMHHLTKKMHSQVTTAVSGNEAINLLEHDNRFDLIISDYDMKDGNGVVLLQYIIQKHIQSPFVFFTSETNLSVSPVPDNYLGKIAKSHPQRLFELLSLFKRTKQSNIPH